MSRLNKIKQNILITSCTALLIGCGGSGTTTTSTETISTTVIQEGQVKESTTGQGLENVEVSIGSHTVTTDANGFYIFSDLTEDQEAVINFKKEGYILGSTKIQIKKLSGDHTPSSNYLEYKMYDHGQQWTYESQNGATGGAVEIPAGAIHTDTVGNVYDGIVYGRWSFKDTMTDTGKDAFTGSFEGVNTNGVLVPFVSYGFMSVELKDNNGTPLSISENITLVLSSVAGTTENILPLWYYDYAQGLWIEEGYAERQSDGTYRGEISHPGTWSLNLAIEEEVGIYRGHIVDKYGAPISDARLYAIGDNWISSDISTNANGLFELEVMPGKKFQLTAYNYKDKYGAAYNAIIEAIASGEIVED